MKNVGLEGRGEDWLERFAQVVRKVTLSLRVFIEYDETWISIKQLTCSSRQIVCIYLTCYVYPRTTLPDLQEYPLPSFTFFPKALSLSLPPPLPLKDPHITTSHRRTTPSPLCFFFSLESSHSYPTPLLYESNLGEKYANK